MIVSLAGTAGAALPNPTPETTNTSTPLAVNSVSRVSADPFAVAVCSELDGGQAGHGVARRGLHPHGRAGAAGDRAR